MIEISPFKTEALRIRDLYSKGRKKEALSLITEEMLEAFAVYGTPKECKARLRVFLQRGITLPIIRVSTSLHSESKRKNAFMQAIESLQNFHPIL